jgi:phosphoribosylglycinamide formyltransferase-1
MKKKIRLAIFASGTGTNAINIIEHFRNHEEIEVFCLLCNRPDALVLQSIAPYDIGTKIFNRDDFYESDEIKSYLNWFQIDYIILAGFLWLMPQNIIEEFPDKIINIHPALLPGYGGKGMYGMKVHEAVIANKDKETGISIHLVNDKYDEGKILFQAKIKIEENDTPSTIAAKIHQLEKEHFPRVIEEYIIRNTNEE